MQTVDPERAQSGLRVLSLLYNLSLFDALIRKYYQSKWFMILPYVVVDSMLLSTRRIFDSFEPAETESRLRDLSVQIFRNSSRPLKPHRNMTIDDYTSSFTGENIRWETIGLMFALSGLSLLATHETDPAIAELRGSSEAKERLLNQVSEATSTCIAFCDHAASSNEILAFAQHTDVMLRTQQYGDSSTLVHLSYHVIMTSKVHSLFFQATRLGVDWETCPLRCMRQGFIRSMGQRTMTAPFS